MGKIVDRSSAAESTYELKHGLFLEIHGDDSVANKTGITPLYEDEIGLWEELEHRHSFCDDAIK